MAQTLGELAVKIGVVGTDNFVKAMGTLSESVNATFKQVDKQFAGLEKIGDRLSGIGSTASIAFTAPLAALGGVSVKLAGDFEASFQKIKALADDVTAPALEKLRAQALKLGADTKF